MNGFNSSILGNKLKTDDFLSIINRHDIFALVGTHAAAYETDSEMNISKFKHFIMYQSIPKPPIPPPPHPRAIPGHLTRVKLRTVGNLTQNEARPVGHLTFVSKRLSAVGNKRISQFFDSARAPRSRVIALVDSTWVFLLLSFLYRGICLCLKCGAKTS